MVLRLAAGRGVTRGTSTSTLLSFALTCRASVQQKANRCARCPQVVEAYATKMHTQPFFETSSFTR